MHDGDAPVFHLDDRRLAALDEAESLIFHSDFCPYLDLKEMLTNGSKLVKRRFRILFTYFYGLNTGGLTDKFKDRFFGILFSGNVIVDGQPAYAEILNELSEIERKQGDRALPLSFVSKLVAMRDESRPIYDRHVLAFFGKRHPASSTEKARRIAWYEDFLGLVRRSYAAWAGDPRFAVILKRFASRDEGLAKCHVVRQVDFLVWKVGNQKLLEVSSGASTEQAANDRGLQ